MTNTNQKSELNVCNVANLVRDFAILSGDELNLEKKANEMFLNLSENYYAESRFYFKTQEFNYPAILRLKPISNLFGDLSRGFIVDCYLDICSNDEYIDSTGKAIAIAINQELGRLGYSTMSQEKK